MNIHVKKFVQFGSLAGLLLLAGCGTHARAAQETTVPIERVNSRSVTITRAQLQHKNEKLILLGEIRNRFPTRAPIPGHLQIELIAHNGDIFKQAVIGYRRTNIKANTARFQLDIPFTLSQFERIRITHHDPDEQSNKALSSPWQNNDNRHHH